MSKRTVVAAVGCGLVAVTLAACTGAATDGRSSDSGGTRTRTVTSSPSATSATPAAPSTSATPTPKPKTPVHISLLNADGAQYGVGMPVIAFFSRTITNAKPLQAATTVTVNGEPAQGAWYFEPSAAGNGPLEAHFRLQDYWPAHAKVHVAIPAKGLSAGSNFAYDDSLTLDFTTGAANISVVSDSSHTISVTSDGKHYGTFPVSLGASNTPTARGTKVIMEQGRDISMRGPGYYDPHVEWTQRLTYGGEYLHSAPWNPYNIGHGIDSSNGCTNLNPDDAERLYKFFEVGDVVKYPNADGPRMTLGAGYGDWNLTWTQWSTGGAVPTQ